MSHLANKKESKLTSDYFVRLWYSFFSFLFFSKVPPSATHLKYLHSAKSIVKYYSAKFPFVFLAVLRSAVIRARFNKYAIRRFPLNLFTPNNSPGAFYFAVSPAVFFGTVPFSRETRSKCLLRSDNRSRRAEQRAQWHTTFRSEDARLLKRCFTCEFSQCRLSKFECR